MTTFNRPHPQGTTLHRVGNHRGWTYARRNTTRTENRRLESTPSLHLTRTAEQPTAIGNRHPFGYRLNFTQLSETSVDTAAAYQNEQGVGRGIRNHRTPREEVFLTTKLWNDDQGYEPALAAFEASLQRLDLDYVDLYLVHWPVGGKIQDTWRAMEEIYEAGRARAIGVSNFLEHQLNELLEKADVVPAVNQIEFHPHLQQNDLVNFCADKGIQVEAWSPLIKGEAIDLPELEEIGKKHGKNAGQVVLRWQLQRRVVTIPKSVRREHIESNAQVFDFTLDEDDMAAIDALDQNRRTGPDPNTFGY